MANTVKIGMAIHQAGAWLTTDLLQRADAALAAHEAGNSTEAVAQTAQWVERFLKLVLERANLPFSGQPALGPLIGAVDKAGQAPREIIERLNQVNRTRNLLLHDQESSTGALSRINVATEGDSLQVLHVLALLANWYRETAPPAEASRSDGALRVFLSVGGAHRLDQEQFLTRLRSAMRRLNVELLQVQGYSEERPFGQICDLLRTCNAALVVGLDRSHAYAVFERERSDGEKVHHDQYVPTAWNQIEGSMASALGLPVLVLRERRLHREGIFEAESHGHRIQDFDLAVEAKGISGSLLEFLQGWIQHVRATQARP